MRLLRIENGGDFSLVERVGNNIPRYAILSHTWGRDEEEVTFKDVENGTGNTKVGYYKIRFCAKQAAKDGLEYFWVDTCCIDKSSSAELQEAINSMFRWYQHAAKCYAILSDVSMGNSMGINLSTQQIPAIQHSRWFTRSWTLQELLAPTSIEFFSAEGKQLGDRISLVQEIHNITGISIRALQGSPLSQFTVNERMSWAEKREAKREEDLAYSLLGIFDIHMPLIYGEGQQRAFIRLRREIEQSSAAIQPTRSMEEAQIGNPMSSSSDQRERKRKILKCLKASPYQDRKDRNPDRVLGTCDWFVSHELFRNWQGSKLSTMLWVSADPGCGKSVLAKYLVDSVLPTTESRTVCYFFFKDDFEDQRNAVSALCCILRQLFIQKPVLLSDTMLDQFDTEGETFSSSFAELWQNLINAAEDENAGEIVCLLDALDECEDQGRAQLTQKLCQLYSTRRSFNLKFLLTSRPYGDIRRGFQPLKIPGLPVIHLSGESDVEMEKISREIDVFIGAKVQDIGALLRLTHDEQDLLLRQLMRVPHRTYLWVYLTLDLIKKDIDIEKSGIVKATSQLPQTVDETYDRILSKSPNPEKAKRILHIVLAAARPLTLSEMALALVLRESHRSYNDLNLRSKDRFHEEVRDACGLFVTVINSKIYLLHQTAKEFLVHDDSVNSPGGVHRDLKWKYSLRPQESHRILTEICIWYLLLAEFETHPLGENGSLSQYLESHVFLDYSAKHWAAHLRELQIKIQDAMTQSILDICDASSGRCLTWFRIYWIRTNTDFPRGFTTLMITSYFGLGTAVKRLLKMDGTNLNSQDHTYQRSALSWAAGNGFDVVVRQLIKVGSIGPKYLKLPFRKRAEVDSVDRDGRTPLVYAVWNGNLAVVKLLIKAGAQVDSMDEIRGTPLSYAAVYGRNEVIKLLLKQGLLVDLEQDISKKLLLSAAREGHEAVVQLLLENGKVNADTKDTDGETPLWWAVKNGHKAIVKLLLETGKVNVNAKDRLYGRTALWWAAERGHEAIVKLLLETGKVNVNAKDSDGRTALCWAAKQGHEAMVKLLLETGKVDVNANSDGQTALWWAARGGHEAIVKLLLETGKVDVNAKDSDGRTALCWAAAGGHKAIVELLLETGKVDVNTEDYSGQTALLWAAAGGHKAIVKLLLETGKVDVNAKDCWCSRTALLWAAGGGHKAIVKLLLETGKVDVNAKDSDGRTALWWAAEGGHEGVVKLLVDAKDWQYGWPALS